MELSDSSSVIDRRMDLFENVSIVGRRYKPKAKRRDKISHRIWRRKKQTARGTRTMDSTANDLTSSPFEISPTRYRYHVFRTSRTVACNLKLTSTHRWTLPLSLSLSLFIESSETNCDHSQNDKIRYAIH